MLSIPIQLAKRLLSRHQQMARNASRLFFWLKLNCGHKFLLTKELRQELRTCFSDHEIRTHLYWLIREHWISVDKSGQHFLRGRKFFRIKFSFTNKKYLSVSEKPFVLESKEAWRNFICGAAISGVERTCIKTIKRTQRMALVASNIGGSAASGKANDGVPLSCSFITSHIDTSVSTASRIRKRAAQGGWCSNRQQFLPYTYSHGFEKPVLFLEMGDADFLQWRGQVAEERGAGEANRVVLRGGKVMIQIPNLVSSSIKVVRRQW